MWNKSAWIGKHSRNELSAVATVVLFYNYSENKYLLTLILCLPCTNCFVGMILFDLHSNLLR